MHKALHQTDDIYKQYVSRKEGRREFASIKDCVDSSIQRLVNKFPDFLYRHLKLS